MNLYAFYYHDALAGSLLALDRDLHREHFSWGRFRNGELFVHLNTLPGGECLALGSIQPPEERLASYFLLCDTLKRHGAVSVTAVLPYLAYSRQDKMEPGMSLAAAWTGQALKASGVDRVMTLDLHSRHVVELFPVALESLPVAGLFVNSIESIDDDVTIVSPDEGGVRRCEELRDAVRSTRPVAHCRKVRTPQGVTSELVGTASPRAIVYDDILDTGDTLVACCEQLIRSGTRRISVCVTHALFTGKTWSRLWDLHVQQITCTDSVPVQPPNDPRISVISCAPAIVAALREQGKELAHG